MCLNLVFFRFGSLRLAWLPIPSVRYAWSVASWCVLQVHSLQCQLAVRHLLLRSWEMDSLAIDKYFLHLLHLWQALPIDCFSFQLHCGPHWDPYATWERRDLAHCYLQFQWQDVLRSWMHAVQHLRQGQYLLNQTTTKSLVSSFYIPYSTCLVAFVLVILYLNFRYHITLGPDATACYN